VRWSDVKPEDRERVKVLSERRLSREEWTAYVNQPVTPDEREAMEGLLDWFVRRYPTPAGRLRYARLAYRRWSTRPLDPILSPRTGRGGADRAG
jgi:hypothetical protein